MIDRREMIVSTASALGYTLTAAGLTSLMTGCQTLGGRKERAYRFFSPSQGRVVEILADLILPETDSPGAVEVGAVGFVDQFVAEIFNDQGRKAFGKSLDRFIALSWFDRIAADDQITELQRLESRIFQDGDNELAVFYKKFKTLLITGYFQSQTIAEEVLAYDPIPGLFQGDISYSGRNWSIVK
jgi:hypothetical protein